MPDIIYKEPETVIIQEDNFEIGLRFMEREIVGLRLSSRSKMRNWMVISMIALVIMTGIFIEAAPTVQQIMTSMESKP